MSPRRKLVQDFIRRSFTENLGLKLVALVASIFLFVILRGSENETRVVSARVVPPQQTERMLVSDIPERVEVRLRGSLSVIDAVRRDGLREIRIPSDVHGAFFYIEPEELDLPTGVEVVSIEPNAIELTWQPRAEARLSIDPVIQGQVPEGFIRVGTLVDPPRVLVRGAAPEVEQLDHIRTRPVDVRDLRAGRHELRVPLMSLPEHVSYAGSDNVVVTVQIEEEEGHRTLEGVEVAVVGGAEVDLRPRRIDIELSGPRARVIDLHPRRVVPFVDVSALDPEGGAQPLPVRFRPLPDEINATAEPSEVLVSPR